MPIVMRFFSWVGRLPPWLRLPLFILFALTVFLAAIVLTIRVLMVRFVWAFVRGLWFRAFPPPVTRDVSILGEESGTIDAVVETVQDEGQLSREHHRRQIYRDPRLLPKPRPPANVWP